jgi:hypothetical protein
MDDSDFVVRLPGDYWTAEFITLNHVLEETFLWFGETDIFVYGFDGELKCKLDTISAKWRVMRTIKEYLMKELGESWDDPPESLA